MTEPKREKQGPARRIRSLENRHNWTTGVIVAALLIGALFFALRRGHDQSQTTTTDGRNVELPSTANGGSAR